MHTGLGRKHPLHIEYIHLGVLLGFISDNIIEAIMGHPKLSLRRKTALIKALNKVIWIQNDLMAKWHIEDGPGMEEVQVEPEGLLHGRKVLDEDEDDDEGDGAAEMARLCPFSGAGAVTAEEPEPSNADGREEDGAAAKSSESQAG